MAFLLGFSVADLDIQQRTPSEERQFLFAACRYVLLSIRFFSRRDEFLGSRLVEESDAGAVHGEDGSDGESAV